jgi:hypothetical protein
MEETSVCVLDGSGDAVGRDYEEHHALPGQGYRNGYRTTRLKTAEGLVEYSAPQIAGRDVIREDVRGHTQGLEDLVEEGEECALHPDQAATQIEIPRSRHHATLRRMPSLRLTSGL